MVIDLTEYVNKKVEITVYGLNKKKKRIYKGWIVYINGRGDVGLKTKWNRRKPNKLLWIPKIRRHNFSIKLLEE